MGAILRALALLLFCATTALAAPAHVQSCHGFSTFASPVSMTCGATIGAGHAFVGAVALRATGQSLSSVTDDKSNSYTVLASNIGGRLYLFIGCNLGSSPITITGTMSAGSADTIAMWGDEYSGTLASSTCSDGGIANTSSTPGSGTDAITSTNLTTTVNGDLIWGSNFDSSTFETPVHGTGFTIENNAVGLNGNTQVWSEDKVQASAGAVAATFTDSVGGSWVYYVGEIAIKPAAGGVTVTPTRTIMGVGT